MSDDSLIQALPDLVASVRRDGLVLRELGGRRLDLPGGASWTGRSLADCWPEDVAAAQLRLVRRVLHERNEGELSFSVGERHFEVRIAAQGRDRVLYVLSQRAQARPSVADDGPEPEGVRASDREARARRALYDRVVDTLASARLREEALALCVIHLHGLDALRRILDHEAVIEAVRVQLAVLGAALARLPGAYAGALTEDSVLVVVPRQPSREALEGALRGLLAELGRPFALGDGSFQVTPRAGVSELGTDGGDARTLLHRAQEAAIDARRQGAAGLRFYTDALRSQSLARLDRGSELRAALEGDRLALRYMARHALDGGERVALQAYLRWSHPLLGEIPIADLLSIAEGTGQAIAVSRWVLDRIVRDLPALRARWGSGWRLSFAPLPAHLASSELARDLAPLCAAGGLDATQLELRLAERTLAGLADPSGTLAPLARLGLRLVVDRYGRGGTSLVRLARLPLSALELDRRLALGAADDPVTRRVASAAIGVARSLELLPYAGGIDGERERALLAGLGCAEGWGGAYGGLAPAPARSPAAARTTTRAVRARPGTRAI